MKRLLPVLPKLAVRSLKALPRLSSFQGLFGRSQGRFGKLRGQR